MSTQEVMLAMGLYLLTNFIVGRYRVEAMGFGCLLFRIYYAFVYWPNLMVGAVLLTYVVTEVLLPELLTYMPAWVPHLAVITGRLAFLASFIGLFWWSKWMWGGNDALDRSFRIERISAYREYRAFGRGASMMLFPANWVFAVFWILAIFLPPIYLSFRITEGVVGLSVRISENKFK